MESFEEMLMRHEGMRATPYIDSVGVQTIGYGHNLHKPLSHAAILQIFQDDLADAKNDCLHAFPWFAELTEARQWVLINMCFNLGLPRLQGFYRFLTAVERGDYQTATTEMLDSLWAKQVKGRARELAALMQGSAGA
jgi:lysozyme